MQAATLIRVTALTAWALGISIPAGSRAEEPKRPTVVVRLVPVTSAPAGWLELELRIAEALRARAAVSSTASQTAERWKAPGFRFDRARMRVRAGLNAAEEAIGHRNWRRAQAKLTDVQGLLDVGRIVAVSNRSTLIRFHELESRLHLGRGGRGSAARKAWRNYLAVSGDEAAAELTRHMGNVVDAMAEEQGAGLSLRVEHDDAALFLDGARLEGRNLRRYGLAAGVHYLRVVVPGRLTHGEKFTLAPGEILRRTITLERAEDSLAKINDSICGGGQASDTQSTRPEADTVAKLDDTRDATVHSDLLLLCWRGGQGMVLRQLKAGGIWGDGVVLSMDATQQELDRQLDRALGLASLELPASAMMNSGGGSGDPDGAFSYGATSETRGVGRWWWAAAGVIVAVGAVAAVVLAGDSDAAPQHAEVWLCPTSEACAP